MSELSLAHRMAERMNEYTLVRIGDLAFKNAQENAAAARSGASLLALSDTDLMRGDSALVIAAGPSLHRQETARLIKDGGYTGILIATESAMAWCLRNDITPDLVVTADPHAARIVRWFGDTTLDDDKLAADDYFARQDMDPSFRDNQLKVNRDLVELLDRHGKDMRICVASSASQAVVKRCNEARMPIYWWNPMFDDYDQPDSLSRKVHKLNGKPCLNAGGNVGAACWVIAHAVLEKRKIGILGMDLGYYAETSYRETQYYNELKEMLGEANIAEGFIHIHNPYLNKKFFTDPAYYWYRTVFLEMAEQAAADGVQTFNCSGGGILFGPGIDFVPFSQFVAATR